MNSRRELSYWLAINEAFTQILEKYDEAFLIWQGVTSPWYVWNTTKWLVDKFWEKRIIDTPISENAITWAAVWAAIVWKKAIVVHPRIDFVYYAMDPIINQAANWNYTLWWQSSCWVTIRSIINRWGEQWCQHSQAIQSIFAHIPWLKVVMPSNAYDAKWLLASAVLDKNPVIYIDDRWLYDEVCEVPEDLYEVEIWKAKIVKEGTDITIVTSSYLVRESIIAAKKLEEEWINCEIVDLVSIKPLDFETILKSIKKTKNVIVIDWARSFCWISAEIIAKIWENNIISSLKSPARRMTLPECPAPTSWILEKEYYIDNIKIYNNIKKYFNK